jgi:hypothetical protein
VPVHQHLGERLGADRPELHRPVGEPLGRPPERRVLERARLDPAAHDGGLVGLHDLVEDMAGPEGPARRPSPVHVAGDPGEPLDRVVEPRPPADREVEARVAVGDDVEAGAHLLADQAAHRVEILLAENAVTQRVLEGALMQPRGEPGGARVGARDRGGEDEVARRVQHGCGDRRG